MNEPSDLKSWWGFRLRLPVGYRPARVKRAELLTFFAIVALVLEGVWLLILVGLSEWAPPDTIWQALARSVRTPVLLAAVPLAIGAVLPRDIAGRVGIETLLIYGREKGGLETWDWWIAILGGIGLTASLLRLEGAIFTTEACMLGLLVGSCLGLMMFQERIDFSKRKRQLELPDWITRIQETDEDDGLDGEGKRLKTKGGVIPVPEGADPVFPFRLPGLKSSFQVGGVIPDAALWQLRLLNSKHDGRLWRDEPVSVVTMNKPPVPVDPHNHPEPIRQICATVGSHARNVQAGRFALAQSVLHFVQTQFKYKYDIDSTPPTLVPGGPFEEYGRFPNETLRDGVGDCECTAILCASLLSYLGFKTALFIVKLTDPDTNDESYHCAVGLNAIGLFPVLEDEYLDGLDYIEASDGSDDLYLYGETATEREIGFGTIPDEWKHGLEVQEIHPIPAASRVDA